MCAVCQQFQGFHQGRISSRAAKFSGSSAEKQRRRLIVTGSKISWLRKHAFKFAAKLQSSEGPSASPEDMAVGLGSAFCGLALGCWAWRRCALGWRCRAWAGRARLARWRGPWAWLLHISSRIFAFLSDCVECAVQCSAVCRWVTGPGGVRGPLLACQTSRRAAPSVLGGVRRGRRCAKHLLACLLVP